MLKHTISFQNAFKGIWTALSTQLNIRLHFLVGSLVVFLAIYLHVSIFELILLVLTIALVMVSEMINTAIEFACDAITLEKNETIKLAKDVSAGAVLLSAIFASLVGIMIFVPKIIPLFSLLKNNI